MALRLLSFHIPVLWLKPDITVVSRDRGSGYAKAAMLGAPQATQCADRFHIVKNLTEATQLILARCQEEIAAASKREEPYQNSSTKQVISLEEWRRHPSQPRWRKRGWPDERGVTRAISR